MSERHTITRPGPEPEAPAPVVTTRRLALWAAFAAVAAVAGCGRKGSLEAPPEAEDGM